MIGFEKEIKIIENEKTINKIRDILDYLHSTICKYYLELFGGTISPYKQFCSTYGEIVFKDTLSIFYDTKVFRLIDNKNLSNLYDCVEDLLSKVRYVLLVKKDNT